jgi:hypothetical protein
MAKGNGFQRKSVEEWRSILGRYEGGGLARQAFCRREGLAPTTFDKWRRKIRSLNVRPEFVDLTPAAGSSVWELEVTLPNGATLRFRG